MPDPVLDLVIRNATLPDGRRGIDVGCLDGRIVAVRPQLEPLGREELDARGQLLSPPFVDSHFHLDSTLTHGRPRVNRSGTLLEGIALWSELKSTMSADDIETRAMDLCHWAIARGNLAIRSHVDVSDASLGVVDVLLEVRTRMRPWLDLQLVAFPQNGYLRAPAARENLARALDRGVDVVGGPHFERTMEEGARSVALLCELAAERGLPVDMHCDESDDPLSRHVESLAFHANRLGLHGRVTGWHLTSMHSMDDYYVSKLMPLMREAGLHVVANPLINITLQGRHDTYPKRRGMTRIKELLAHGVNVAFGHDCVMDPWYGLGSHDMLEVAAMGLHVGHMSGQAQMLACYQAVTANGARVLGLEHYGLAPGCHADMVLLQAGDPVEALRLRATRLAVVRRGRVIARTPESVSTVSLGEADELRVDFSRDGTRSLARRPGVREVAGGRIRVRFGAGTHGVQGDIPGLHWEAGQVWAAGKHGSHEGREIRVSRKK